YSSSKSSSQSENYISPTFVNLDNSYLENPDKTFVEEPARDIDGILYKDSSNNIINVNIPTKTEGDKVKDVSFQAYSYDNYSGVVLAESGVLYGWGKNTNKVLDYDKGVNDFVNDLTPINYGSGITDDVRYVEADLYTQNTQSTILALGDDGYLYMWGNATLIPTAVSVTDRVKIDLSNPSMTTDPSHSSKIVSYNYSPSFVTMNLVNEDGYLYTIGDPSSVHYSGRGCEGGSEPFNEKFYRQDINCNGNIDDDKVKSAGVTDHTSYFITEDDYLYMYGNNVSGQAGQGNEIQQTIPVFVNIDGSFNDINGDGIQQSGSGEDGTKTEDDKVVLADNSNANHTLAIDKKGDLYMWGADAASGRMPKTSDDPFIRNGHNTKPIKVNFVEHEDGEKYTHSSYWNSGGIASSDYLNIYYWGSYIPGVDWTNTYELSTVYKVTKEDFITPAIKI
ncbi:MAG: hypothetical protein HRS57_03200, partial [Mycoplasmataceae bacterium]|nr:hypothetical protein [Mycoplasmataceae bacterium]